MQAGVCRTDCILDTSGRTHGAVNAHPIIKWCGTVETTPDNRTLPMGEAPSILQRTPLIVLSSRDHVQQHMDVQHKVYM